MQHNSFYPKKKENADLKRQNKAKGLLNTTFANNYVVLCRRFWKKKKIRQPSKIRRLKKELLCTFEPSLPGSPGSPVDPWGP